MTINERIRVLSEQRGMSQYRLAKLTNISQGLINNYFTGRSTPKAENLQKIADALEVPIAVFLAPDAFDVTIDGEVRIVDEKADNLARLVRLMDDFDDDELKLAEDMIKMIRARRN